MLVTLILPGCKATPAYQGGNRSVLATYHFGTLTADLPIADRVPAVMAAAKQALLDRGYAIQLDRTEDEGRIEALAPGAGDLERTTVRARVTGTGTQVLVRVEPFGDQAQARAVLDGILGRLGL